MAKDPAVLFYTSDFLTGTMLMNDEQVGKYIRLLCLQHHKKFLSEEDMLKICKTYDKDIWNKFVYTDNGFHNERMTSEIEKRSNYSESRRNNRKKKESEKDMCNISNTYVKHMENENENVNEDIDINSNSIAIHKKEKEKKQKVKSESSSLHKIFLEEYSVFFNREFGFNPSFQESDFKGLKLLIKYLMNQTGGDEEKTLQSWKVILQNWNLLSDFLKSKATLREINSNITKILIEIKTSYNRKSTPTSASGKHYADMINKIKNGEI